MNDIFKSFIKALATDFVQTRTINLNIGRKITSPNTLVLFSAYFNTLRNLNQYLLTCDLFPGLLTFLHIARLWNAYELLNYPIS